jgi:multicomponent Na+:H+ antiporter subunit B
LKLFNYILLAAFTALMLYTTGYLPERGAQDAPLHREENVAGGPVAGAYFIRNAYEDTATPNMVTVVLADYRSFDTLGEVIVVFAAGICCYLILRRRDDSGEDVK